MGSNRWVVVTATNDGSHIDALTAKLQGDGVPKALAQIIGGRSLLERTIERYATVAPPERTIVMVPRGHEARARAQLQRRAMHIVAEPAQRGTATSMMVALTHILENDPTAEVLVTPADHHVPRPVPMLAAVETAFVTAARRRSLALVGCVAESAATDRAYIVRGVPLAGGAYELGRFVEKPNMRAAHFLLAARGLWSTGLVAGRARTLWEVAASHLRESAALIESHVRVQGGMGDAYALAALYDRLATGDLTRDIFVGSEGLIVVPVESSGWCDWSTPERVFASLGEGALDELFGRMFRQRAASV